MHPHCMCIANLPTINYPPLLSIPPYWLHTEILEIVQEKFWMYRLHCILDLVGHFKSRSIEVWVTRRGSEKLCFVVTYFMLYLTNLKQFIKTVYSATRAESIIIIKILLALVRGLQAYTPAAPEAPSCWSCLDFNEMFTIFDELERHHYWPGSILFQAAILNVTWLVMFKNVFKVYEGWNLTNFCLQTQLRSV